MTRKYHIDQFKRNCFYCKADTRFGDFDHYGNFECDHCRHELERLSARINQASSRGPAPRRARLASAASLRAGHGSEGRYPCIRTNISTNPMAQSKR